jgi:hypothetical protein
MKANVTFKLHLSDDAASYLARITGLVLTTSQLKETSFRTSPKGTSFTVRTNDVMSLLQQFETEGFMMEVDFAQVSITPCN